MPVECGPDGVCVFVCVRVWHSVCVCVWVCVVSVVEKQRVMALGEPTTVCVFGRGNQACIVYVIQVAPQRHPWREPARSLASVHLCQLFLALVCFQSVFCQVYCKWGTVFYDVLMIYKHWHIHLTFSYNMCQRSPLKIAGQVRNPRNGILSSTNSSELMCVMVNTPMTWFFPAHASWTSSTCIVAQNQTRSVASIFLPH